MRFSLSILLLAGVALAAPSMNEVRDGGGDGGDGGVYDPCSGLYDSPQCCATDVLGVADLDCQNLEGNPSGPDEFTAICARGGQRARCCVLPVAGQAVLCQTPVGVND